jgi:hypothetical protein
MTPPYLVGGTHHNSTTANLDAMYGRFRRHYYTDHDHTPQKYVHYNALKLVFYQWQFVWTIQVRGKSAENTVSIGKYSSQTCPSNSSLVRRGSETRHVEFRNRIRIHRSIRFCCWLAVPENRSYRNIARPKIGDRAEFPSVSKRFSAGYIMNLWSRLARLLHVASYEGGSCLHAAW